MRRFFLFVVIAALVNVSGCRTIMDMFFDDGSPSLSDYQHEAISRRYSGSERAQWDAADAHQQVPRD